ncbi:MAG: hypothetical protein IKZ48_03985 [Prevotella sp.]|nr:hypothetical protein [Prevotella sp.]
MKKIFTLFAAVLLAVGANAQKITFEVGQTPTDGFANGNFKIAIVDEDGKFVIDANSQYFGTAESQEHFTARLKTGGKSSSKNNITVTVPADGALKICVRTASSGATDRTLTLTQGGTELYKQVVKEADAVKVTGLNEDDPAAETNVFPIVSVSVKAGDIAVTYPEGALNFYAFEFAEGESGNQGGGQGGNDDPDPTPDPTTASSINYPTSEAGITLGGTTVKGTVKIHENKDAVDCISLKNGYTTDDVMNGNHILLEVEGGFKAGDVVTIAGAINNSDESKHGTADLFVTEDGQVATSLNVFEDFINSRFVAEDPAVQTYTLTTDYPKLYIGRNGNTGTNLTLIKVGRGDEDNILNVKITTNEGITYNLAGQKVSSNYKGITIQNGKKMMMK